MIVAVCDGFGFLDGWTPLHDVRTGMADAADVARAASSARRVQAPNADAYTHWRWITAKSEAPYPM